MTATAITGSINPLSQGFLLCVGIIIAFGPQNLFLLRQGLRRQHLFVTVLFSTLIDIVLIALGVGGLSALISTNSMIQTIVTVGGVVFLTWTGSRSLLNARRPSLKAVHAAPSTAAISIQTTIIAALSFSLLNPGKYLDTLVTIGSQSLIFPVEQRLTFAIGAVLASAFWFFTLTYGASKLTPVFRAPCAWRALDIVSGSIMLFMAITMLISSIPQR